MLYHVNTSRVMHETIDDETIIVDLTTGTYFSLRGTAAAIWGQLADGGIAAEELEGVVRARYEAPEGEIETTLRDFLGELEKEQLVVVSANGNGATAPALPAAGEREQFAPPRLERYTDMQDIILLDPVHEVDPRGWPHAPAGA